MSADDTTAAGDLSVGAADGVPDSGDATDTPEAAEEESEPIALPLDQVFEMVKNERRRLALDYLRRQSDETTLGELAEHIAAIENDKPVKAISSQERKRVYVGLYQCHLPKMDDLDVVEFNQDRGLIRLGPNAERLYPYIDPEADEGTEGWARVYLGVALLGGLTLLVSIVGGVAGSAVPALVAGALVCSVGACALYQILTQDRS